MLGGEFSCIYRFPRLLVIEDSFANMPKRGSNAGRSAAYQQRTKRNKRPVSIKARRMSYRRKGLARPTRSLRTAYRGTPNQYRFVRETRPVTIDLGTASAEGDAHATPSVTIIAGTPNTAMVNFGHFTMSALVNFEAEFDPLFANYKIDSITTFLIPQWSQGVQLLSNPTSAHQYPNLMLTRVNTKFLPGGYTVPATAEASRDKLAQIQMKTRSIYGTHKWLKIVTRNPDVPLDVPDGAAGVNSTQQSAPWLPIKASSNQQFIMNDTFFADTFNGDSLPAGIYKYRVYHKVNFRVAFVG